MDYMEELEQEIKEIEKLIEICKKEEYSKSLILILTALYIRKTENFKKIVK